MQSSTQSLDLMHDDMHIGVEVSPGIVSNLFKDRAQDTIGGKQGRRFRLDGIPGTCACLCAGAERPQGNAVLTFRGSQADLHVNRALIREESPEERESQSLLWSLGLLTIPLTPI